MEYHTRARSVAFNVLDRHRREPPHLLVWIGERFTQRRQSRLRFRANLLQRDGRAIAGADILILLNRAIKAGTASAAPRPISPISGEVFGQLDEGFAAGIRRHIAVVDVHHVRRFDEGVREIFVFGIKRVIYFE